MAWAFTPRLRLASAVCTGLRDSCCGEPLAEGVQQFAKLLDVRSSFLVPYTPLAVQIAHATASACTPRRLAVEALI